MTARGKTRRGERPWLRFAATGAAIGAYFGYFFQPVRTPGLTTPLLLGGAAALFTILLRLFRGWRPGSGTILLSFFRSYALYAFLLGLLEARHLTYAGGGRLLTLLVMALCGAGAGLFFAWRGIDDFYRNVESGR